MVKIAEILTGIKGLKVKCDEKDNPFIPTIRHILYRKTYFNLLRPQYIREYLKYNTEDQIFDSIRQLIMEDYHKRYK